MSEMGMTPIATMSLMEARKSLLVQVQMIARTRQDIIELGDIYQLDDDAITDMARISIVQAENFALTVMQIQALEAADEQGS